MEESANPYKLTFDGKKLKIVNKNTNETLESYDAISGLPGNHHPSRQIIPFGGPVPEGNYKVWPENFPDMAKWRVDNNLQPAGKTLDAEYASWGPSATRLYDPVEGQPDRKN